MERRFRQLVVDALFPRFCLGCSREGTIWCSSCSSIWWPVPFRGGCPFCGMGNTDRTCLSCRVDTYLDGLMTFASYANPVVREAITQWKFIGDVAVEPVLFQWLVRAAPSFFSDVTGAVFVPVPLHRRKRRARGFDQSATLTDWCSQLFSLPAYDVLKRTKFNPPQSQRRQTTRSLGELDDIFQIAPGVTELPERVVLCDDVFTSGATMDSAARVLKEAGVREVLGFVLARGNSHP